MLDIHSHILPKMDDGSKSVEMSLDMISSSAQQGVTTLVSTSHFYADVESPDEFLRRRAHAAEKLKSDLTDSAPKIFYGAEVLYFPGLAQSEEIPKLRIEGTNLILIEMPFVPWSEKIFDELLSFQYATKLHVVLAHVERYLGIQNRSTYRLMFDQPFYFQCNAEAFSSMRTRRLAMDMLDSGLLHFLGTDCHNLTSRSPNMAQAQAVIEKKRSSRVWKELTEEAENRFYSHIR